MNTIQSDVHIGVDVGKSELDFHCHESGEHFIVGNSLDGIRQAFKRLPGGITRLVVEATGRHEQLLVIAAQERRIPVIVAQPIAIRRFAGALGVWPKPTSWTAGSLPTMPQYWRRRFVSCRTKPLVNSRT